MDILHVIADLKYIYQLDQTQPSETKIFANIHTIKTPEITGTTHQITTPEITGNGRLYDQNKPPLKPLQHFHINPRSSHQNSQTMSQAPCKTLLRKEA